jgi:hypothetical protein
MIQVYKEAFNARATSLRARRVAETYQNYPQSRTSYYHKQKNSSRKTQTN